MFSRLRYAAILALCLVASAWMFSENILEQMNCNPDTVSLGTEIPKLRQLCTTRDFIRANHWIRESLNFRSIGWQTVPSETDRDFAFRVYGRQLWFLRELAGKSGVWVRANPEEKAQFVFGSDSDGTDYRLSAFSLAPTGDLGLLTERSATTGRSRTTLFNVATKQVIKAVNGNVASVNPWSPNGDFFLILYCSTSAIWKFWLTPTVRCELQQHSADKQLVSKADRFEIGDLAKIWYRPSASYVDQTRVLVRLYEDVSSTQTGFLVNFSSAKDDRIKKLFARDERVEWSLVVAPSNLLLIDKDRDDRQRVRTLSIATGLKTTVATNLDKDSTWLTATGVAGGTCIEIQKSEARTISCVGSSLGIDKFSAAANQTVEIFDQDESTQCVGIEISVERQLSSREIRCPKSDQSSESAFVYENSGADTAISTGLEYGVSADGTKLPMTVYRRKSTAKAAVPTMLSVYGAYGAVSMGNIPPQILEWVGAGGVWAICHTRGSGFYGQRWHQAGQKYGKLKTVEDAIACAQHLISSGIATSNSLAIMGSSAGGIPAASAAVMRPELFRVVVLRNALLDTTKMRNSQPNIPEFGDPQIRLERESMETFSPYQVLEKKQPCTALPLFVMHAAQDDQQVDYKQTLHFAESLRKCSETPDPIVILERWGGHSLRKRTIADTNAFSSLLDRAIFNQLGFRK